jgi:hypothetical protein
MDEARKLKPKEREALLCILEAASFDGARELAFQVDLTTVVGGLPTLLDLSVDPSASAADCVDGPLPVDTTVLSRFGEPEGGILVWVKDGYLSALEHYWYTDEPPTEFPSADRIRTSSGG